MYGFVPLRGLKMTMQFNEIICGAFINLFTADRVLINFLEQNPDKFNFEECVIIIRVHQSLSRILKAKDAMELDKYIVQTRIKIKVEQIKLRSQSTKATLDIDGLMTCMERQLTTLCQQLNI